MTDRRYSDEEVAEIFKRAATAPSNLPAPPEVGDGLSLSQLQEVGLEVGIGAEQVAAAARSLDSAPVANVGTLLGLPIAVRESVELGRRLTDAEWSQMVVAARETFAARGKLRDEGEFREWSNGNLAMMLEPSPTGHRIRFQTRNGNAEGMVRLGAMMTGFGGVMAAVGLGIGGAKAAKMMVLVSMFLGLGVLFGAGALIRLPPWARRRGEQMRQLASKAQELIEGSKSLEP